MSETASPTKDPGLLQPLRGEARALDSAVRGEMEHALGSPFGDVVIHTGAASGAVADGLDAAAFTVGRHVVFGPSRYDPASVRGRMLLAHELSHVLQQRSGGGDVDLGQREPLSALTLQAGHSEAQASDGARAALAGAAAPIGSASVGIARQTKEDEKDWRKDLWAATQEYAREKTKLALGTVEGVVMEGGQIVDTLIWAETKGVDAVDDAIDYAGHKAGLAEETIAAAKALDLSSVKAAREDSKKRGLIDPNTGAPAISGGITRAFTSLEGALDKHVFAGAKQEEGFFSDREIGQLGGAIGSQALLAYVGVEEVQIGLKVVSGLGVIKSIADAVEQNPKGFAKDRRFWTAIANAVLHVAGLAAASAGKKIITLIVDVLSVSLSATTEVAQLQADFARPAGEERDKAIKQDTQALIKVVAGAVQQAVTHHKSLKAKQPEAAADHTPPTNQPPNPPANGTPESTHTTGAKAPTTNEPVTQAPSATTTPAAHQPEAPPHTVTPELTQTGGKKPTTPASEVPKGTPPPKVTQKSTADPAPQPANRPTASQDVLPQTPAADKPIGKPKGKSGAAGKKPVDAAPADETSGHGPQEPVKPKTPSEAKEFAEAGQRMHKAAEDRHEAAKKAVTDANEQLPIARERLARAEAAAAAVPPGSVKPKKKLPPAEKELRDARIALARAEANVARAAEKAEALGVTAKNAKQESAKRAATFEEAKKAAEARKEAAAAARDQEKPSDVARSRWEGSLRGKQAKMLGARPNEQIHHAIELKVLDIPEFEGAFQPHELNDISNMRVIPLELSKDVEVGKAETAALSTARNNSRENWPQHVSDLVDLADPRRKSASPLDESQKIPVLKNRDPEGRAADLHQSAIRSDWNDAYSKIKGELAAAQASGKLLPGTAAHKSFVRSRLLNHRKYLDWKYGSFWGQSKRKAGL